MILVIINFECNILLFLFTDFWKNVQTPNSLIHFSDTDSEQITSISL